MTAWVKNPKLWAAVRDKTKRQRGESNPQYWKRVLDRYKSTGGRLEEDEPEEGSELS